MLGQRNQERAWDQIDLVDRDDLGLPQFAKLRQEPYTRYCRYAVKDWSECLADRRSQSRVSGNCHDPIQAQRAIDNVKGFGELEVWIVGVGAAKAAGAGEEWRTLGEGLPVGCGVFSGAFDVFPNWLIGQIPIDGQPTSPAGMVLDGGIDGLDLKSGADFAQVAAGTSDAKDALKGGDLGWRSGDSIPPLFMNELQNMKPGQSSAVLRSPSGFHILKLVEKRSSNAPVVITQTHARHILIKTSEIMPEAEAKKRTMEIKQRIDAGADFAEQAKRYSQDGSAQQGGDLDWLSPGQTVPEFEAEMNKLKPGQIGMVQTQFGWHLIQVLERRNTDVSEQQKRQQARVAIGTFKSDEMFQDWLRQLRDRAFIEYRLDEKK